MKDLLLFLTHARWHCLFGPDNSIQREPDRADLDAAAIISNLKRSIGHQDSNR